MKRYIVLLLVFGATSEAVGEEIYFIRTEPLAHLVKVNADGTGLTTILTSADVHAFIVAAIPEANDGVTNHIDDFYLDSVNRKLIIRAWYDTLASPALRLPVLLRSDIDGTNIEIVFHPGAAGSSSNEGFASPQVLQDTLSVPAVSTWGLGVMVLLLGIAATVVIRRRAAGLAV